MTVSDTMILPPSHRHRNGGGSVRTAEGSDSHEESIASSRLIDFPRSGGVEDKCGITILHLYRNIGGQRGTTLESKKRRPQHIKQGQIYYVDFPAGIGSVQAGIRPAIITSNNIRNSTSPTVIVAIVTSSIKKLHLDEHVELPRVSGLSKKSMAAVEQRFTVDKSQLLDYCGRLKWEDYRKVHRAIRSIESAEKKTYKS